jgi:hypothetical protein
MLLLTWQKPPLLYHCNNTFCIRISPGDIGIRAYYHYPVSLFTIIHLFYKVPIVEQG